MEDCVKACCAGCIQGVCIACCVTVFELCREVACRPMCERCCNGLFDACSCCAGAKRSTRSYSFEEGSRSGLNGGGNGTYDPPIVTVVPMNVQPVGSVTTVPAADTSGAAYPVPAAPLDRDACCPAPPATQEMNRSVV